MKSILFLFICNCLSSNLQAQTTMNSMNCFQLNATSTLGFAVLSTPFDDFTSQTGSSYVWDFSSSGSPGPWTSWTNPTTTYVFRAATASNHTSFIASEINEYAILAFSRDHFYTYSSGGDSLYFDGYYNSSNKVYMPHVPYLTFPINYGDSIYSSTIQTGGTAVGPGIVNRYWIYDGFGTLKLPYGQEDNIVRLRTHQLDSSTVTNTAVSVLDELIWIRQSDGIPVLRFIKQGASNIAVYYGGVNGVSGIKEVSEDENFSISPNPSSSAITLSFNAPEAQFSIFDMNGKKLLSKYITNQESIDLSAFEKGMYIVKMNGKTQRLIIE